MLTFLGDVALNEKTLNSDYKPNTPYIFNLEYVLFEKENDFVPAPNKINLKSQQCNFDEIFGKNPIAVNLANNHIYDYGQEGFDFTWSKVKQKQILPIIDEPLFISENLAIISYMLLKNTQFVFEKEKFKKAFEKINSKNPNARIVVQLHWGVENSPKETEEQKEISHWLIDNGVDLIIGHHPHCLQSVEQYKGKWIFYSIGNALFGNINLFSHYDQNRVPKRKYRFKWQSWNKKSFAVKYDEIENEVVSIDLLYQKKNKLVCVKSNVSPNKLVREKKFNSLIFTLRKYYLFFISNFLVDGKIFDVKALIHEMRGM